MGVVAIHKVMAGGTLCCIVAVKNANFGKKGRHFFVSRFSHCDCFIGSLEEFSVKLVLSRQDDTVGERMQAMARGLCLERLLGISLHRLIV